MQFSNILFAFTPIFALLSAVTANPIDAANNNVVDLGEHPLGHVRDISKTSFAPTTDRQDLGTLDLTTLTGGDSDQKCWWGSPYGCTDGYCWKTCGAFGSGNWCWTNRGDQWARCASYTGCSTSLRCGGDCSC